jgi:hypothetical protein
MPRPFFFAATQTAIAVVAVTNTPTLPSTPMATQTATAAVSPTYTPIPQPISTMITVTAVPAKANFALARDGEDTPTEAVNNRSAQSVVAAPNISRDGQPVNFLVNLDKPALVKISIFNLAGEEVYQTSAQGNTGTNRLVWQVQNQAARMVSSGLYIYVLQLDEGANVETHEGKILVFR